MGCRLGELAGSGQSEAGQGAVDGRVSGCSSCASASASATDTDRRRPQCPAARNRQVRSCSCLLPRCYLLPRCHPACLSEPHRRTCPPRTAALLPHPLPTFPFISHASRCLASRRCKADQSLGWWDDNACPSSQLESCPASQRVRQCGSFGAQTRAAATDPSSKRRHRTSLPHAAPAYLIPR